MTAPARIVTIGVHGFDLDTFLQTLRDADVRVLHDVRQRRGVRGPEYAWANSRRLQDALAAAGIAYAHQRTLAPTTELRQLQYDEDRRQGVGKRSRHELADAYVLRYTAEILDLADLAPIVSTLPANGAAALSASNRTRSPATARSSPAASPRSSDSTSSTSVGPPPASGDEYGAGRTPAARSNSSSVHDAEDIGSRHAGVADADDHGRRVHRGCVQR